MPLSRRVLAAMNLGAGLTIGSMAVGHLVAVSVTICVIGSFAASLVFPSSGQRFERFRGLV